MIKKTKLKTVLMLVVVACLAFSCKKNSSEIVQQHESEKVLDSEICRGPNPQQTDSLNASHSTPSCITALIQNSDYDFWDFDNMVHFHEFDTAGYYNYFVPAVYFSESNILCLCVKNNEIALRYAMMFPSDFDYQTYYNQEKIAYVDILSYDYEETFYSGNLNVRYGTFQFTYVNPLFLDDDSKYPPLHHWNDMNLCEKIITGLETTWYIGLNVHAFFNPLLGGIDFLAGEANAAACDFMRRKACQ